VSAFSSISGGSTYTTVKTCLAVEALASSLLLVLGVDLLLLLVRQGLVFLVLLLVQLSLATGDLLQKQSSMNMQD
jgi:hypothetical protein